jgi:hypothetical protein
MIEFIQWVTNEATQTQHGVLAGIAFYVYILCLTIRGD